MLISAYVVASQITTTSTQSPFHGSVGNRPKTKP